MEYFALGFLTPLLSWVLVTYGWQAIFYGTGAIGIVVALIWHYNYKDPAECSAMNEAELKYIKNGGALAESGVTPGKTVSWQTVGKLFRQRKLIGMFIGQFSVMTTLFFFLTWFPSYLITAKGLLGISGGLLNFFANIGSATSPMIVGFIVQGTGGFNMALAYVSFVSICGICAYLFVLTTVERIVLVDN